MFFEILRFDDPLRIENAQIFMSGLPAAMSACSFVKVALVGGGQAFQDESFCDNVRQDMDIIDNSLDFVNVLLRDMLDTHRISSRELKIEARPTDIYNDILKPVDSMLYRRGNNQIQVEINCVPADLIVNTDPLRLKQVILNLARNSSKFVQRGYIRLSACVLSESGHVQLSVEDSGPGIPPAQRGRLFHKFQESLDTVRQGTGIGLHLSKNLVELMNGRIYLDETYESGVAGCPGTRFVIDLNIPPCNPADLDNSVLSDVQEDTDNENDDIGRRIGTFTASNDVPRSDTKDDETGVQGRSNNLSYPDELPKEMTVLFVDDDVIVRKLFRRSVQKIVPTWIVHEASNGETAIQLATEEKIHFDLMFIDMYMASSVKQLLGTETVMELRAKGVDSIVCGFSGNDMEEQFLEAKADCFMLKPFPCQADQLEKELKRVVFSRMKQ